MSDDTASATPLDAFAVDIEYSVRDRFGADADGEPNERGVEGISATISILAEDSRREAGTMSLARIHLWECDDELAYVLDAESTEWTAYYQTITELLDEQAPRCLLMADRVELEPWARGHGIGLHVLARAIRTWGEDGLVVMTAWPPGGSGATGRTGGEALARYWSRLGMTRVADSSPPILYGRTEQRRFDNILVALSEWPPREPAGSAAD